MFTCLSVEVKAHAALRMYERGISRAEVEFVVQHGRVIIEYLTDQPLPSFLLLAFPNGRFACWLDTMLKRTIAPSSPFTSQTLPFGQPTSP